MTDRLDRLEAELAAMRPLEISAELVDRIGPQLHEPNRPRWPDRLLIFAMSAGSAAAAVIVGVLLIESQSNPAVTAPMNTASIIQQRGDPPLAFARADANWP
jgi:hypothetical protein